MQPDDCVCDGFHTDAAAVNVSNEDLRVLLTMEYCPAEKRAIRRVIESRRVLR